MAIVRHLERKALGRDVPHTDCDCTYSIVHDHAGKRYLQIDTYGSDSRKMPDKKSPSIRFSPEAMGELKDLLNNHFQQPLLDSDR